MPVTAGGQARQIALRAQTQATTRLLAASAPQQSLAVDTALAAQTALAPVTQTGTTTPLAPQDPLPCVLLDGPKIMAFASRTTPGR